VEVAKETCRNNRILQFLFGLNSMGENIFGDLREAAFRRQRMTDAIRGAADWRNI
jgi:hypothetical protein